MKPIADAGVARPGRPARRRHSQIQIDVTMTPHDRWFADDAAAAQMRAGGLTPNR
jgi:hypothetical protein